MTIFGRQNIIKIWRPFKTTRSLNTHLQEDVVVEVVGHVHGLLERRIDRDVVDPRIQDLKSSKNRIGNSNNPRTDTMGTPMRKSRWHYIDSASMYCGVCIRGWGTKLTAVGED